MLKLGFANGWVELVMRCVTSVSYYFLINGEVEGFFFFQVEELGKETHCHLISLLFVHMVCLN